MYPDRLNDEGAAECYVLFDDIRALDHLGFPDCDGPAPHQVVPGECQLLDDIRAADRILLGEVRRDKVSPAGHRSARNYAKLRISRKRGVEPENGNRKESTIFVLDGSDQPRAQQSMTYSARAPPVARHWMR